MKAGLMPSRDTKGLRHEMKMTKSNLKRQGIYLACFRCEADSKATCIYETCLSMYILRSKDVCPI